MPAAGVARSLPVSALKGIPKAYRMLSQGPSECLSGLWVTGPDPARPGLFLPVFYRRVHRYQREKLHNFRFHVFFSYKIYIFLRSGSRAARRLPQGHGNKKRKNRFFKIFRFFYIFVITRHFDPMEPCFELSDG